MPFYISGRKIDNFAVGVILFGAVVFGFLVGCVFILSL